MLRQFLQRAANSARSGSGSAAIRSSAAASSSSSSSSTASPSSYYQPQQSSYQHPSSHYSSTPQSYFNSSSSSSYSQQPPPSSSLPPAQPPSAPPQTLYIRRIPMTSLSQSFRAWFGRNGKRVWFWIAAIGGVIAYEWYTGKELTFISLQPNVGSATRFIPTRPKTRLSDVMGCDEAKAEVYEIIEYLKDPKKFTQLGGKMPKGVLLLGPPGTGKTLLARACAGEANVSFFSTTGADFEEMWIGVGAKRMRELFAAAREKSPAIIFIDEIDTVGGKRGPYDNPKARMSLNQLLTELDGFKESKGIIIMAATNFAEKLDPALLRPGRFDKHVTVEAPDIKGRKAILDLYAAKMKLDPTIDLNIIARGTGGMTGADLHHLLNSASIRAAVLNKPSITLNDIEYAKDKILMGVERVTAQNPPETIRRIAVYEGGKSLAALLTPDAEPIHKVTVIQRGSVLGKTVQQRKQNDDAVSRNYKAFLALLDIHLAGRVAEEMIYGENGVSTVSARDLAQATKIARKMIMNYGYSDKAGFRSYDTNSYAAESSHHSKQEIDEEVKMLLTQAHERVKTKLHENRDVLDRVVRALIKHETLDGEQLKKIVEGNEPESVATADLL